MHKFDFIQDFLDKRQESSRLRTLKDFEFISSSRLRLAGKEYINFSSNDYLGLSTAKELTLASNEATTEFGVGNTASRLVCGNHGLFSALEKQLIDWKNAEAALVFNSGYQANSTLIPAIADRHTVIFSDKLNHASIIDGIILSRAKHIRYGHNDMEELSEQLKKFPDKRKLIISETLFSMDGDIVDLKQLAKISDEHEALLYIDDAHGSGIYGPKGRGPAWEIMESVDIYVGTFGKAMGSFGAYCLSSEQLKSYLVNASRGLIYSTALPPSVLAANIAAVKKVQKMDSERSHLSSLVKNFRSYIFQSPFSTIEGDSPIVPLIVGPESDTLKLSEHLLENGIFAIAIRPPTVPEGTCRIRFTLTANHSEEDLSELTSALNSWK